MAGELINVIGSYATVQASASTATGSISGGAVTTITTALGATEAAYALLDFKILITLNSPTADGYITIYRKNSDQPAPTNSYLHERVGRAALDTQTGLYYLRGIDNTDPADTFYTKNDSGTTITYSMEARGRTSKVAV